MLVHVLVVAAVEVNGKQIVTGGFHVLLSWRKHTGLLGNNISEKSYGYVRRLCSVESAEDAVVRRGRTTAAVARRPPHVELTDTPWFARDGEINANLSFESQI